MYESRSSISATQIALWAIGLIATINLLIVGYVCKTVISTDRRVAVIEAGQFTQADAQAIRDRLSAVEARIALWADQSKLSGGNR